MAKRMTFTLELIYEGFAPPHEMERLIGVALDKAFLEGDTNADLGLFRVTRTGVMFAAKGEE